ncbi:MAG: GNAT family N-acetyltransferase, partial [Evtepia sp.]
LFWRIRMSRPAGLPEPPAQPVRTAEPAENQAVLAFLRQNFSPLTGCLPNKAELAEALGQGQVLVLEEAGEYTGLLHYSYDGKSGEIRHLAVRANHRGRGLTRPLITAFLQAVGGAKSTVWLREDFPAARAAYETMGFAPDGRRSAVLCYDPK